MKKLFTFFIFVFAAQFYAQTDSVYYGNRTNDSTKNKLKKKVKKEWMKRITYGGNFGLLFGNYTYVNLSPTIGYIPFKKCNIGVGVIYNYYSINYGPQYGRLTQTVYGGRAYARYLITTSLFATAQYDKLLQPDFFNNYNPEKKVWVDYMMVGGGYRMPVGDYSSLVASIMYNLTPSALSIYQNPYIQIGFSGRF